MATDPMSAFLQHLRGTMVSRDGTGPSDGQLLDDFIGRREEAALAALVRRHGPMVWGVCRRILRNYHDAEDAFQATFLVLVRKAASIVPREMVANWLYGVAHQTALKARATVATRKERERQVTEMPEPEAVQQDLARDLQSLLDAELSRLPDKYRVVIVLCDLEAKTRKEAARHLGCPEGTVAGRLARARSMLAKRLARHGLAMSGGALTAVLARNAASAAVPMPVVSSTIEAATLFAAGQATATGAIPVKVVALMEGVLKSMLLTKLKIATAGLLVFGLLATGAIGLARLATAEGPLHPKQEQTVPALETKNPKEVQKELRKWQLDVEKEVKKLREEVERLRSENEALKDGFQKKARIEEAAEGKPVIKVYPVADLKGGEEGAESLIRVITNTIEFGSWAAQGGLGSIEYFAAGESLVVRHTPDLQKQVESLLESLRKVKAEQQKKDRK